MKIRIKGNSIRYRLTRSEVQSFCDTGHFAETTEFNGRTFTYALRVSDAKSYIDAEFVGDTITLIVPAVMCKDWNINEQVGFAHTLVLDNSNELFLLVEKDFICMDRTMEDQSDNYPNPRAM